MTELHVPKEHHAWFLAGLEYGRAEGISQVADQLREGAQKYERALAAQPAKSKKARALVEQSRVWVDVLAAQAHSLAERAKEQARVAQAAIASAQHAPPRGGVAEAVLGMLRGRGR